MSICHHQERASFVGIYKVYYFVVNCYPIYVSAEVSGLLKNSFAFSKVVYYMYKPHICNNSIHI